MLVSEGKIFEETNESRNLSFLMKQYSDTESVRKELKKNPRIYEKNCFTTRDLSVYNRRLIFYSGILSVYIYNIVF